MESKQKIYSSAIGRRKSAIASVRLVSGNGQIKVNSKPSNQYFPGLSSKVRLESPFSKVKVSKYDASVKVIGGGQTGQLDATVLGISRSLAELKGEYKVILRNAGLLTRDSRERQRRMIGTGGKARRQKQSPKR